VFGDASLDRSALYQPVLDRFARDSLTNLRADLLATVRELLQPAGGLQFRLRAAATRTPPGGSGELACLRDRGLEQLAGLRRQVG